jgi:uncharacterized protein
MLPVTTLTASVLGLFYVWLAIQVIRLRRNHKVSTGEGGHHDLTHAIRAHGNCAEYLPISLILLGLAELNQGETWVLAGFAGLIVAGRAFHALAYLGKTAHLPRRILGMKLTFIAINGLALYDLGLVVAAGWTKLGT